MEEANRVLQVSQQGLLADGVWGVGERKLRRTPRVWSELQGRWGYHCLKGRIIGTNLGTSGARHGHVGFESQCDMPAGLSK